MIQVVVRRKVCGVYVNTWGYDFKIKRKFIKHLFKNPIQGFSKYYFKLNVAIIIGFTLIDPLFMIFIMQCLLYLHSMDMVF